MDSNATVMVTPGLSLQRVGVQALMLYASTVASSQFKSASLLTKSCHAGLLTLMMSTWGCLYSVLGCIYGKFRLGDS